jgi:hypothetical protein
MPLRVRLNTLLGVAMVRCEARLVGASDLCDADRSEAAGAEATAFPLTSWPTVPERAVESIIRRTASAPFIGASDAKLRTEARSWSSKRTVPERGMGTSTVFPWDA